MPRLNNVMSFSQTWHATSLHGSVIIQRPTLVNGYTASYIGRCLLRRGTPRPYMGR
ncbi:MAG: hypothetical protein HDS84_08840 [Bacteroidales bacterium]|nr:hypothetical protein [Bacteroidales bacterium]